METPLEHIGKMRLVEEISRNMRVETDYIEDLCQEVYFILLTGYTDEKLQEVVDNNQINYIITKILKNLWFSKTSPFYRQYKKYNLNKTKIEDYKENPEDEE